MARTVVAVTAASQRAHVDLVGAAMVPRLISRDATSARVALVAGGALLLGGDEIGIDIAVGAGCVLDIEDVGGTVAYDADGERSSWTAHARVEAGGVLRWHGLPLVVATGAYVHRSTRIDLAADAVALMRETTVLGRSGESGGRMVVHTDVERDGVPVLVETLDASGSAPEPGVLGRHRVLDTVLAVGFRPVDVSGALAFEEPGALARYLGADTHPSPLNDVWRSWSAAL